MPNQTKQETLNAAILIVDPTEDVTDDITQDNHVEKVPQSPFFQYFENLTYRNVIDRSNNVTTTNKYYRPKFAKKLKNKLTSIVLWGSIMLGDLRRHGTSETYTEFKRNYQYKKLIKVQKYIAQLQNSRHNRTQFQRGQNHTIPQSLFSAFI